MMHPFEVVIGELPTGVEYSIHARGVISTDREVWHEAELAALSPGMSVTATLLGRFETVAGWPYLVVRATTAEETILVALFHLDDHGVVAKVRCDDAAILHAFETAQILQHPAIISIAQVWATLEVS